MPSAARQLAEAAHAAKADNLSLSPGCGQSVNQGPETNRAIRRQRFTLVRGTNCVPGAVRGSAPGRGATASTRVLSSP